MRAVVAALPAALLLGGCTMSSASQDLPFRAQRSACLPVGPGPEDFAVLEQADGGARLFASVKTRRLWRKQSDDGSIVEVQLDRQGRQVEKPTPLWPTRQDDAARPEARRTAIAGLQPVGISLTEINGRKHLYVIDSDGKDGGLIRDLDVTESGVASGGEPIRLKAPAAGRAADLLPSANGILALPDGHIYVSNPVTPYSPVAWLLYYWSQWPALIHIAPQRAGEEREAKIVPAAAGVSFANGIAADPEGRRLFVADYSGRRLVVFERDPGNGTLGKSYSIPIEGLPDNLMTDGKTLYIAAQRSRIRTFCHLMAPGLCGSPSRAYAIDLVDIDAHGAQARPQLLWDDGGAQVQAGSTAYRLGDKLLVSQIVANGIYVFDRRDAVNGASATPPACTSEQ
jgi:hypothetical protein